MTWFSLTPLVFLTPYVWDSAAHFVRGRVEALGALTERGFGIAGELTAPTRVSSTEACQPSRPVCADKLEPTRSVSATTPRTQSANKVLAALSEGRSSAALLPSGTVVVSVADGCLPAEQPAVPANDLGSALTGALEAVA